MCNGENFSVIAPHLITRRRRFGNPSTRHVRSGPRVTSEHYRETALQTLRKSLILWRKGWDLNPRYGFPYA
jgi:hypothetical protein